VYPQREATREDIFQRDVRTLGVKITLLLLFLRGMLRNTSIHSCLAIRITDENLLEAAHGGVTAVMLPHEAIDSSRK
jgi:hypothetical protein